MTCTRCGKEVPKSSAICPACGSALPRQPMRVQTVESARQHQQWQANEPLTTPPHLASARQPDSSKSSPWHETNSLHSNGAWHTRSSYTFYSNRSAPSTFHAVKIELLFSLFGIFGVGWCMARKGIIGIPLLLCSVFIYWPAIILLTRLTFGFGLLCLAPFALGAVMLNALLLNVIIRHQRLHV